MITKQVFQELEEAGVRISVADPNDPEEIGMVQWRPALYIVGNLNNGMCLLDMFFKHISDLAAKANTFEVQITPHTGINLEDILDEFEFDNYILNDETKTPPLKIFEAAPVYGKKVTTFNIEILNDVEVNIVITHVYAFRDGFETIGIQGGRIGATSNTKGEYVRLMPKLDVVKEEDRVIKVIEDVLHNVALRALLDGKYEENTPVDKFLKTLRERPNMHF